MRRNKRYYRPYQARKGSGPTKASEKLFTQLLTYIPLNILDQAYAMTNKQLAHFYHSLLNNALFLEGYKHKGIKKRAEEITQQFKGIQHTLRAHYEKLIEKTPAFYEHYHAWRKKCIFSHRYEPTLSFLIDSRQPPYTFNPIEEYLQ